MILVLAQLGSNGTGIVKRLASLNVEVRALVHNRDRTQCNASSMVAKEHPPPQRRVDGDDRPETLLGVLAGVKRAFLAKLIGTRRSATNCFH